MTKIYGVNIQTYYHLPPDDQASIRESYISRKVDNDPKPLPTPDVGKAKTPADAVQALQQLPVPDVGDLPTNLSPDQRDVLVAQRAITFNTTRAEAAQAALDRLEPQRDDYSALGGSTANYEYQQARQNFGSNPYAQELRRIVSEAKAAPEVIPSYLTNSNDATDKARQFAPEQMRTALASMGVNLPENPTPEQMTAGYQILDTMPNDILATVINPGSQVSFTGAAGVGTPNLLGPNVQYGVDVQGKVDLGDVRTGVNFQQSQQFKMSVQVQGGTAFDLSKTPLQRVYKWADRLGQLPDAARDLVDRSPILRQVIKGLPVSGSYTEFEGARLSYEAVVTPQQGTQLANGDPSGAPNPLDPLNMPEGTSLLMRGQSLAGSRFEANWKALTAGDTNTELSGQGFGVTRGEGSIVEVYSGPVDTVENTAFFGLGRQGSFAIGFGSDMSTEKRQMQIARIDLSTAEGQAAYQTFISTGQVPRWSPPGVQQSGTTEVFSHEYARFIGLQVGGLEIGDSSDSGSTITRTSWADGTEEYSNTYTSSGGMTTEVRGTPGEDGSLDQSTARWTVVRANVDPILANILESAYDPSRLNQSPANKQHIEQVFTSSELMEIRGRARAYLVNLSGQEQLDKLDSGVVASLGPSKLDALATADTPEKVFGVISNDFQSGQVFESLRVLTMGGNAIPGRFRMIEAG